MQQNLPCARPLLVMAAYAMVFGIAAVKLHTHQCEVAVLPNLYPLIFAPLHRILARFTRAIGQ